MHVIVNNHIISQVAHTYSFKLLINSSVGQLFFVESRKKKHVKRTSVSNTVINLWKCQRTVFFVLISIFATMYGTLTVSSTCCLTLAFFENLYDFNFSLQFTHKNRKRSNSNSSKNNQQLLFLCHSLSISI